MIVNMYLSRIFVKHKWYALALIVQPASYAFVACHQCQKMLVHFFFFHTCRLAIFPWIYKRAAGRLHMYVRVSVCILAFFCSDGRVCTRKKKVHWSCASVLFIAKWCWYAGCTFLITLLLFLHDRYALGEVTSVARPGFLQDIKKYENNVYATLVSYDILFLYHLLVSFCF